MSKNWDRENMKTLAANVRKEDAEAFAKIAKENNTTVGGMLRMFVRDSVQKTAGKPEPLSGVFHVVSYKNTDRLKHEVSFHNPDHLNPDMMLNRIQFDLVAVLLQAFQHTQTLLERTAAACTQQCCTV